MTHVPLPIIFFVLTMMIAALIIMVNQVPLPAWYTQHRAKLSVTEAGDFFISIRPSHQYNTIYRGKHRDVHITGVHLKDSIAITRGMRMDGA